MSLERCPWCGTDPLYVQYHDREWGVPTRDDRTLFEFLVLEGAQAGLSWITVLRKREGYRRAFQEFDPEAVARLGPARLEELAGDPGIVRHRGKIRSAVENARAFLQVQEDFGSFAAYAWDFVGGSPVVGRWREMAQVPAMTPASEALSRDLKRRGFRFVGPTIAYAWMQAVGLVNDHLQSCFRWEECAS